MLPVELSVASPRVLAMSVPPPYPPPAQPGGWNAPPAGTDWSSAPGGGYPPPGVPGPGYPGYPGAPQGYPAGPKPGTNGFAIASLIFGIISGWVLALIFGFIALSQTKKTGQNGRGLAIAGLVLGGLWIIAYAGIIVAVVLSQAKRDDKGTINAGGDVSATALQVGDCVNNLKDSNNLLSLPAVPCSQAHEGEVFAVYDLPSGPYPPELSSGAGVPDSIQQSCSEKFGTYAPDASTGNVGLFVLYPLPANWAKGDHSVNCIATVQGGGTTTGSLKNK
jgi:Domain of unknown function (DUF4190)/Septum formation